MVTDFDGAELSLGLSSDSDSGFDEPDRVSNADVTTRDPQSPAAMSTTSETTPAEEVRGASASPAKPDRSESTPVVKCKRCSDERCVLEHDPACPDKRKDKKYIECPRCRHVCFTRAQFRRHLKTCLGDEGLTCEQRRNRWNPQDLAKHAEKVIKLEQCVRCQCFRHFDAKLLALHEVLCKDLRAGAPPPRLPSRASLYSKAGEFTLPVELATVVSALFRRHTAWKVSTRLGFLWVVAERVMLRAPPQVITPGVPESRAGSPAPAGPSRMRSVVQLPERPAVAPPAPQLVSPLLIKRTHTAESAARKRKHEEPRFTVTKRHPSATQSVAVNRRQVEHSAARAPALSPREMSAQLAVVQPEPRWSEDPLPPRTPTLDDIPLPTPPPPPPPEQVKVVSPARKTVLPPPPPPLTSPPLPPTPPLAPTAVGSPPPSKVPSAVSQYLAARDRLKLLLPDGSWCDAYGRPTSPRRHAKHMLPKRLPTMIGHLAATSHYVGNPLVRVNGHLPSGWGRIVLPDGTAHAAYKAAPGDPEPVPDALRAMRYYVTLYLTTKVGGPGSAAEPPAGTLHFDIDLRQHPRTTYTAAGIKTSLCVSVATPSGGQE